MHRMHCPASRTTTDLWACAPPENTTHQLSRPDALCSMRLKAPYSAQYVNHCASRRGCCDSGASTALRLAYTG